MSLKPIIDLSDIDLSSVAADQRSIAQILPHRGDMLMLSRIVWHDHTHDHAVAVKEVGQNEFWVPGHIPGYALMPGVLMVEAGAQLSSWMYYQRSGKSWFAGFTRIEDTTFRGQVLPGDTLVLMSECLKYHEKRFVSRVQGWVDGNPVFQSKITGMAFPKISMGERRPLEEFNEAGCSAGGA